MAEDALKIFLEELNLNYLLVSQASLEFEMEQGVVVKKVDQMNEKKGLHLVGQNQNNKNHMSFRLLHYYDEGEVVKKMEMQIQNKVAMEA